MPSSVYTLGLMASAVAGQIDTLKQCTADTAGECAKLTDLIKPACVGAWRCNSGKCEWKCSDTTLIEPEKCQDGTLVRDAARKCYEAGTQLIDKSTCECSQPVTQDGCPQDVIDGCKKEGGMLDSRSCECKRPLYCPGSDILKTAKAEKCAAQGLKMDFETCECMTQDPTQDLDRVTCKYNYMGETVEVPVLKARYECGSKGSAHVFGYDATTATCTCKRIAVSDEDMCPAPNDSVPYSFAKIECGKKGMYNYPRTYNFDPRTCECAPVPQDKQEPVDCSAFDSCDKENPCLGERGKCLPFNTDSKSCPEQSKPCDRFGDGGIAESICPDGTRYEDMKAKCLANPPSVWWPYRCACQLVIPTDKCEDGSDYDATKLKCAESGGRFVPETCECRMPADAKCSDTSVDYAAAKKECEMQATMFWVEEPHCKCIDKTDRPTTEGCDAFTSIEDAKRSCPGMQEDPPTQWFDRSSCECRELVTTKPMEIQPVAKIQRMKMIICREGLTKENVMDAIAKIMFYLKEKLTLKYPNATIRFHEATPITRDGQVCIAVKFSVIHSTKIDLVVKELEETFTKSEDVQEAIKSTLAKGDEAKDEMPVALAFEVETQDIPVGSAFAAAPAAASLLASVIALFA